MGLSPMTRTFARHTDKNAKIYEKIYWQTAFPCILAMFFDISDTHNSHFPLSVWWWPPGSSIPNAFWFHLTEGATEPSCCYHHYFHVSASAITVIHNHTTGHWRAGKLLPMRKIRRKISALKWIYLIPVFFRYTDWGLTTWRSFLLFLSRRMK